MKNNEVFSPHGIQSALSPLEMEQAIEFIKTHFSSQLAKALNLHKVVAPMLVKRGTGINDDLNGTERPVNFSAPALGNETVEVVHSLAKWKRMKIGQLGLNAGEGIITDMRAIRADEELSPIHSLYVDQWDWEKRILPVERKLDTLKQTVKAIYAAILETELELSAAFGVLAPVLPKEITLIHAGELQEQYPGLTAKQREDKVAEQYGAVFIIGIGGQMAGGEKHDGRAPDYDDWSTPTEGGYMGLNGDIVVWNPVLKRAFELSSMGIRVNAESLRHQLELAGCPERAKLPFHAALLAEKLPQTIGGGIGQSRLCMFMLRKKHIGEVQASIWPDAMVDSCLKNDIGLL